MKKSLCIISLLAAMLFSMATAFAATETTTVIDENYDLKSIKTLAITTPYYKPSAQSVYLNEKNRPNAPKIVTTDMLVQAAVDVAKEDDTGLTVLSDKQINSAILNSTGIDITTLDKAAAKKLYKDNIKNYADAYAVFTFSNDSYVVMTVDIYNAKDNNYILSYRIINGKQENDTIENYNMFMHKFYRMLTLESEK